jgi:uncharacterized membrane protein YhdT
MALQADSMMITLMRWLARLVGALMVVLFVVFFVGESLGGDAPGHLTLGEWLEMAALLIMLAGALLAWRWEAVGGALSLGGGLAFNVVESLGGGRVELVWFAVAFMVVGALFLLCGYHSARREGGLSPSP